MVKFGIVGSLFASCNTTIKREVVPLASRFFAKLKTVTQLAN